MLSDDLLELQRIDSATDQLAYRRANLPERAAAETASAELARTTSQIAALIARQRQLNDDIEEAEQTGAELTRHRERLQGQLRTVSSPREAEALTHELDALATRRDELDDAELANLEEQSKVVDDLAAAHRAEVELAATAERSTSDLAAAEAAIDAQIAEYTVQRSEAVTRLDGGTLADYEQPAGPPRRRRRRQARRPPLRRLPPRLVDVRARRGEGDAGGGVHRLPAVRADADPLDGAGGGCSCGSSARP